MAEICIVLGESGSGKSTSLRNFTKEEARILNVSGKRLPFKNEIPTLNLRKYAYQERYNYIKGALKKYEKECKTFIIDDLQYLMSFEYFDTQIQGFEKFNQIGKRMEDLFHFIQTELSDDVIVYMLTHIELKDDGKYGIKTIGKMLDEKITLEGLVTIVIRCINENDNYFFKLHGDGTDTVKTPMGMFEEMTMDNDLKAFNKVVRAYYDMKEV